MHWNENMQHTIVLNMLRWIICELYWLFVLLHFIYTFLYTRTWKHKTRSDTKYSKLGVVVTEPAPVKGGSTNTVCLDYKKNSHQKSSISIGLCGNVGNISIDMIETCKQEVIFTIYDTKMIIKTIQHVKSKSVVVRKLITPSLLFVHRVVEKHGHLPVSKVLLQASIFSWENKPPYHINLLIFLIWR